jgi:hypothetical protein
MVKLYQVLVRNGIWYRVPATYVPKNRNEIVIHSTTRTVQYGLEPRDMPNATTVRPFIQS